MTGHDIAHALVQMVIEIVGWTLAPLVLAAVLMPFLFVWDWIKRRLWPLTEDPDRCVQAEAWAALKAEAEERTRERHPRDPHVLTMTRTIPRSPAETDGPIRLS